MYQGGFRKHAAAVISFSVSPSTCGGCKPFAPNFIIVPCGSTRTLTGILSRRPRITKFLIRPVRKRTNTCMPSRKCLGGYCSLYHTRGMLFVTSRIRANVTHANGLLTYSCRGIRPSVLVLKGTLSNKTYPISTMLSYGRIVSIVHPKRRNSAFNKGPVTTTITIATLRMMQSRRLTSETCELKLVFQRRVEGLYRASHITSFIQNGKLLGTLVVGGSRAGSLT